jgi:hypothetical protein
MAMKLKPVRISDISRVVRISSASLIEFLQGKGYTVLNDYRSPLSGRMVELIQNGYSEGPPFQELIPYLLQAEAWEKQNAEIVKKLHQPPQQPPGKEKAKRERPPGMSKRKPRPVQKTPAAATIPSGKVHVTPLDLELIQQALQLPEEQKILVRDHLRRKLLLEAISRMD